MSKKILITGGMGYIGSHTAVSLVSEGYYPILFDNLSNSRLEVLDALNSITKEKLVFVHGDICDKKKLIEVMTEFHIDAVIHFAGLKAVGESVVKPLFYYENNVGGTITLLNAMKECNVKKIVFSSSATVYGEPKYLPLDESHHRSATNPYGQSKIFIEKILEDIALYQGFSVVNLRYFNPVGAHKSGLIGDNPLNIPNNLMPYIAQVSTGKLDKLSIFGFDYNTPDGTGIRDYVHVVDLAEAHIKALEYIMNNDGISSFNIGTGQGYSVLEVIRSYEIASGKSIPFKFHDRRPGDISECYASAEKANRILGWKAKYNLEDMCLSSWVFEQNK